MTSQLWSAGTLRDDEHVNAFYRLALQTFEHVTDVEAVLARARSFDEGRPDFCPDHRRGVVSDGELLGGYFLFRRHMWMGNDYVTTGCIGDVVTHPGHRGRGVGRALMEDAVAHATRRGDALLLLDGIPNFYSRFGYVDVFDDTIQVIDRRSIPAEIPRHRVRSAGPDDAPELLRLYRRHHGRYGGSFLRTLDRMDQRLEVELARGREPAVVEGEAGHLLGYIYLEPGAQLAREVAADCWPAALSLLHYHAGNPTLSSEEYPALRWRLPSDSETFYLLADHLITPQRKEGEERQYAVRSVTQFQRDGGWVARVASLPVLLEGLLPVWQERWQRSNRPFEGAIELSVGSDQFSLQLDADALHIDQASTPSTATAALTPQAFTQLVFGYRPVHWIARQAQEQVPVELCPVLDILFPSGRFWIAGTDAF